jgi:hypothetical protein
MEKGKRKSKSAVGRSLAQCWCALLRKDATAALKLRKESKILAQRQYLAAKAVQAAPIASA